jgi:tryptophanyl-tRNA synthetase
MSNQPISGMIERMKQRVLSGIRATGRLHLGNYLGAVKGMLELQDNPDYETLYMVADGHTLTTPYDVEELRQDRRAVMLDYLAAGLDPARSVIFLQSMVPEHFELAFYFSSIMTIARMQHLPTFKDKVKQHPEHATMALLNYPVLMAADILVYRASVVPVGIDQEPHLEVAREVARKMNSSFGMSFPEPKRFVTKGEYVPSLLGEGKMSKSVEGSHISLTDDLQAIQKRLAGVPTDGGQGSQVPTTGGVANLLTLVELFQGESRRLEYEKAYLADGVRYGDLKQELAGVIFQELEPIQERRAQLEADQKYVDQVIEEGAAQARAIASEVVAEVKTRMGLA